MQDGDNIISHLQHRFGDDAFQQQTTADGITTVCIKPERLVEFTSFLKKAYPLLYDLCAVDERDRQKRNGMIAADFTVVYHLFSFKANELSKKDLHDVVKFIHAWKGY